MSSNKTKKFRIKKINYFSQSYKDFDLIYFLCRFHFWNSCSLSQIESKTILINNYFTNHQIKYQCQRRCSNLMHFPFQYHPHVLHEENKFYQLYCSLKICRMIFSQCICEDIPTRWQYFHEAHFFVQ
jgi:hypothetical protein